MLRRAIPSDVDWINARYKEIEFAPSNLKEEIIVIAELEHTKVGLGRLTPIDEHTLELGGMYVLPEFRKRGIAKEIVTYLLKCKRAEDTLYCIPFVHLLSFYESFGFVEVKKMALVPNPVLTRFSWVRQTHTPDMALMVYKKDCTPTAPLL